MPSPDWRLLLTLAVFGALAAAQTRAQYRSQYVHQRVFQVEGADGSPQKVLAIFPRRTDGRSHPPNARYGLVIALHGAGEAARGLDRGFLGWGVDYQLPEAFGALQRGRLAFGDYRGQVTERHLRMVNASLRQETFEGVMVVCPYTPNLMARADDVRAHAGWLAGPFLAQVRAQFPGAARTRAGTGVDGVSLGGMIALETGLRHPEAFGAVGAIQPAIRGRVGQLASLAAHNDGRQHIRLLTSEGDPFLGVTEELSARLRQAAVAHTLAVFPGRHDYTFNRGPGAVELLRFHERVLSRESL